MLFILCLGAGLAFPDQDTLSRFKAAGVCSGVLLTLSVFLLNARRDHATADFQFLSACGDDLLLIHKRMLQLRARCANRQSDIVLLVEVQIDISKRLIDAYWTAEMQLRQALKVPLPHSQSRPV